MSLCNISVLNLLFFGIFLTIYTVIGEVVVYIPIAIIFLAKYYQVAVTNPTFVKESWLLKNISFFLLVAVIERGMVVNGLIILSNYTSFFLICAASYLVINIDLILSNKVSDETIISIIISYLYLLLLCFYPQNVSSFSFTIWLVIAVSLYFIFTDQLLKDITLTSAQVMVVEQSQWLLFIYSVFRLISKVFEVKLLLSLIFYISALILFLIITFTIIKQHKQLKTSLTIANLSACLLITTLGVECCYYAVQS